MMNWSQIVGEVDRIDLKIDTDSSRIVDTWRSVRGVQEVIVENGYTSLLVQDSNFDICHGCLTRPIRQAHAYLSVDIQEPNLEAVFLHLTGRALTRLRKIVSWMGGK
jgi:ABC-2 type transport system ATP-binding protein